MTSCSAPPKLTSAEEVIAIPKSALVALARVLAPFVSAELATLADEPTFSSPDGNRPHNVSRRAFRERCKGIPSARKIGRDWIVPQRAWFEHVRTPAAPAAPASSTRAIEAAADSMLLDAFAGAALRPTFAAGRR